MPDEVHSPRSLDKLLNSYWERCIQSTAKHLRWSVLQKNNAWVQVCNQKIFREGEVSKTPHGNVWEIFLLDTPKTTFWMENLTQRLTKSGPFFQTLFWIFINWQGRPPCPSCMSVNVAEYALMSLNIPKYLERCLNKVFYAKALIITDHFTCLVGFWNCLMF